MVTVEVYTSRTCPYCSRAKELLNSKGGRFRELLVDEIRRLFLKQLHEAEGVGQFHRFLLKTIMSKGMIVLRNRIKKENLIRRNSIIDRV